MLKKICSSQNLKNSQHFTELFWAFTNFWSPTPFGLAGSLHDVKIKQIFFWQAADLLVAEAAYSSEGPVPSPSYSCSSSCSCLSQWESILGQTPPTIPLSRPLKPCQQSHPHPHPSPSTSPSSLSRSKSHFNQILNWQLLDIWGFNRTARFKLGSKCQPAPGNIREWMEPAEHTLRGSFSFRFA